MLPVTSTARKEIPIFTGVLQYFPDALAEVAKVSRAGNEQHSPGEPMHWARGKSMDQEDCLVRHLLERGTIDTDGQRHSAKVAWRALAILQLEIENERPPTTRRLSDDAKESDDSRSIDGNRKAQADQRISGTAFNRVINNNREVEQCDPRVYQRPTHLGSVPPVSPMVDPGQTSGNGGCGSQAKGIGSEATKHADSIRRWEDACRRTYNERDGF